MSDGPHKVIRILTVIVGASIIGATLGALVTPGSTGGEVLVSITIISLSVAGVYGVVNDEPIVGALAGLGFLLLVEHIEALALFLFAGAFGFLIVSTLAALEDFLARRRED